MHRKIFVELKKNMKEYVVDLKLTLTGNQLI